MLEKSELPPIFEHLGTRLTVIYNLNPTVFLEMKPLTDPISYKHNFCWSIPRPYLAPVVAHCHEAIKNWSQGRPGDEADILTNIA